MRIATWNLDGKPKDNATCRKRLQKEMESEADVDVWVITEPFPQLSITGFERKARSAATQSGKHWTEIWVREGKGIQPDAKSTRGLQFSRTACVKLTRTDIGSLYIFGTVLPWNSDQGDDLHAGTKSERKSRFCAALDHQRDDWQRIRNEETDPDVGFCLAGDFNKESFGSWSSGERGHLACVLRESGLTCLTTDATGADPTKTPLEIDHICVSNHFRRMPGESRAEMFIPRNCHFQQGTRKWYKAEHQPLTDHSGVVATLVRCT